MKALLARISRPDPQIILAALFSIAVLHIATVFTAPQMALDTAYKRMAPALKANTMIVFPPVAPGSQPLPYMAPDARIAVCHFDTRSGKVALSATLPGPGWSLTLYDPQGIASYTAVGRADRAVTISLLLVPDDDRFMGLSPEAQGLRSPRQSQLQVQARKGLAVLRAPDAGYAYRAQVEAQLKTARCTALAGN